MDKINFLYFTILIISVALGYLGGFAGYSWTKWIAMPCFAYGFGALVKFMWAY